MLENIDTFPPYCYPIDYKIDRLKLTNSLDILLQRLNIDNNYKYTINLTHIPGMIGDNRWRQYIDNHVELKKNNIDEVNFTELLTEVKDLYIGQIIQEIYAQHNGNFQGRCQIAIMEPKSNFGRHVDKHTKSRYHIPLVTNKDCYWFFYKNKKFYKLHMPADDKVWYFDPVNIEHDFHNVSDQYRWHLLLTSGKD